MRRIRSSWPASTSSMDRTGMPGSTGGYANTPVASAALLVWSARAFSVPGALDRRSPPRKLLRARMIAGQSSRSMRFSVGLTTRVQPEWPGFQGAFGISPVVFGWTPLTPDCVRA